MVDKNIEYKVISNSIDTLCLLCAADRDKTINLLTGYLWDEEEAGCIKRSNWKINPTGHIGE